MTADGNVTSPFAKKIIKNNLTKVILTLYRNIY